jgi:hypothetical protein
MVISCDSGPDRFGFAASNGGLARNCCTWINVLFLFCVSILPFSTTLLAQFTEYRLALVV